MAPRDARWQLPALIAGLIIAVFGGYELLERSRLRDADAGLLRTLHAARGLSASLVAAAGAAWWCRRASPRRAFAPALSAVAAAEGIEEQLRWFVGMRWLAAGMTTVVVFASQHVLGPLPAEVTPYLWAGCAALWVTNAAFARSGTEFGDLRSRLSWLIAADLLILTHLLHFSGGLENPLFFLYSFHAIIAGILLPVRDAWRVCALIGALFLALTLGEYSHLLPHYAFLLFPHEAAGGEVHHAAHELPFVLGRTGAFFVMLGGTAYFTTTIMERLRSGQRRLLQAEKLGALGQLVAYIAHEVNNPIGIISARMKLARSGAPEYETGEFLGETLAIVDRQADRVAAVVRSLLNLAKPHLQPKGPVDVNETLREALYLLSPRLRQAGVSVEERLAEGLPSLQSRRNDLLHIFLNVLNNALDAMPDGGRLTVASAAADGRLVASIADTGAGMPPEVVERVFEPLFTTKSSARGTGLGLPVSLTLARSLGGDIKAESVPGRGAVFHVRLPLPA